MTIRQSRALADRGELLVNDDRIVRSTTTSRSGPRATVVIHFDDGRTISGLRRRHDGARRLAAAARRRRSCRSIALHGWSATPSSKGRAATVTDRAAVDPRCSSTATRPASSSAICSVPAAVRTGSGERPAAVPDGRARPRLLRPGRRRRGGGPRARVACSRTRPCTRRTSSESDSAIGSIRVACVRGRSSACLRPSPWFRPLLPAYVAHFSRLEVPASRLVLSNSSTFARGVRARSPGDPRRLRPLAAAFRVGRRCLPGTRSSFPIAAPRRRCAPRAPTLRRWDRWAGRRRRRRRGQLAATCSDRIRAAWGRDSTVIHPPVDVAGSTSRHRPTTASTSWRPGCSPTSASTSRSTPAQRLGRDLVVVGDGPERTRLERMAGPRTRFDGHVDRDRARGAARASCHALIARDRGLRDRDRRGDGGRQAGDRVCSRRRRSRP